MSTSQETIEIRGIQVLVLRKKVKNLHLNVLPPDGSVRVTAPLEMSEDAIRTFIATRISWIKRKQLNFINQERQTARKHVSGESHYFLGGRYRLQVKTAEVKPQVEFKGKNKLVLTTRPNSNSKKRESVMQEWYREELKNLIDPLIEKWLKKINVTVSFWGIRRMKTRWGTCNEESKRIWFNLELIKKPKSCIEYVVVHELVHLLERTHNNKFMHFMDIYLPKWRSEKDELNRLILAHEEWDH